ncbi:MAG: 1-(5-phosphoribosyl)-5-[(5-phosphoribosylamino)methylideneamino]imidazole-4-carboxamide isomerase [Chloroflexi bacterium RBG_16_60_22]|nr:MAG: 1-(5-phosphoribosyl)-5-[(5-phosphoribosylamino)methylideneamino]imidazole-4-carboxamide isomerase [Chloroflexi bacterium RBG_16_60_22]
MSVGVRPEIEIIPAIDLRDGRCVRLYQGDYNRETVFSEDPLDVALKWQSMGAPRLHIVDLDGAAAGEIRNLDIIRDIARAALIPVQLGGGIRDLATVETLLKAGIERVILGTAAVEDPRLVSEACRYFRDSVIVGIDAREGYAATHGWVTDTGRTALDLARAMAALGVRRFIYTDIGRDGTLTEPNFAAVAGMVEALRLPVIAAGGITTAGHLKMLAKLGAEGAIVGKALYTGNIDLKQALAEVDRM